MKDASYLFIFLFLFGIIAGALFAMAITSDNWRQDIIDHGFAEWQLVNGTKEVEFKWK